MHRFHDPNKAPLFRGGERMRLMAMVGSLLVLGMVILRARDARTWRWLARGDESLSPRVLDEQDRALGRNAPTANPGRPLPPPRHFEIRSSSVIEQPPIAANDAERLLALSDEIAPPPSDAPPTAPPQPPATPPPATLPPASSLQPPASSPGLADDVPPPDATLDPRFADNMPAPTAAAAPIAQDSIERSQFAEDARAIVDKQELRAEDMPAYWRLVDWEKGQTFQQMDKLVPGGLSYASLFKDPEKYRGQLVRLNLRIVRALATHADALGMARGLARLYEAWGYTEESAPNPYAIVFTSLPADFPLGNDIQEDATFVGYFLKVIAYQSRDDKRRTAPLLIGKLLWRQAPAVASPVNANAIAVSAIAASATTGSADDVPPPEATLDPRLADKSEPGSPAERPKAPFNAARPDAANLADDVPPPEATLDPTLADKAGASSETTISPEYQSSIEARAADNMPPSTVEDVPVDKDPIERAQFDEDAQAITDKRELRPEEMSAYWRLVDWEKGQTFQEMDARARGDLTYSHLFKDPELYRGTLVRLKLRINRALATDADALGKARGLARTYEANGYTEESAPNSYAIVLTELPPDFPLQHDMQEDVTFVGYFFKLMAFQSRDDKHRAAPLLIGKLFWHQNPAASPVNINWLLAIAAGVMAIVMLAVRMTFKMTPLRSRGLLPPLHDDEQSVPIETWLERIEEAAPGEAPPVNRLGLNGHSDSAHSTNGTSQHHPEKFSEDPDG